MKFMVFNRGQVPTVPEMMTAPWALISISHKDDHPELVSEQFMNARMNQIYHDIDRASPFHPERILFTPAMADDVLDFYEIQKSQGVETIVVHCQAGLCRSPATAAALQKIDTGDDDVWFKTKRPNMLVYNTILQRAFDRGMLDV